MSGRERLRRGWLRFGKVGRKPNKDGKNRLCLEKNRCREEEEFPVVKGISKRVIVVKSPDPKIFEQAIFIIREDFAGQSGVSEKDVLREARAAANSYLGGGKRTTGKLFARLRAPLYAAAGCELHAGFRYRHCLVLRAAASGAELTPPHDITGKPVAGHLPEGENRALLLSLMERSREILRKHPVNQKRIEAGLHPANSVWFWGEGRRPALTPFREKFGIARGGVISAVDLVQGIGVCAGLEVIPVAGITGNYHTDFAAKGRAAVEALRSGFDFLYIHVEAPDECGHHGEAKEKIWSIEQIDEKIILPVLEYLRESGEAFSALCMPDHPTPLAKLTHTPTPVPYALYRSGVNAGNDHRFTEAEAEKTGVFTKEACMLMPRLLEE